MVDRISKSTTGLGWPVRLQEIRLLAGSGKLRSGRNPSTPCREGLPWIEKILASIDSGDGRPEDIKLLEDHTRYLGPGNTFCALAPGAMEPLQSALKYFREDFEVHIKEKRCSYETKAATKALRH